MCIRDRAGTERVVLGEALAQAVEALGDGFDFRGRTGQRLGCLLYTSDAADERSSVDLGGRRIIKKKKIEETREQQANK